MMNNIDTENFITEKLTRMQLANLRKSLGMTQKEVSLKADLSLSCVNNIESGEDMSPNLKSLNKYLNAIGYEMVFKKKEI